jgi:L-seryl-tRNA(Ser) seleniumtransferase
VHVVNSGAAALVLAATALAAGREIVAGRAELVDIEPGLLVSTGARLREVGGGSRSEYEAALGPQTGFVLKVQQSAGGGGAAVDVADLTDLPVPVVVDIGAGLLAPDPLLPEEADAATALRAGAALVTVNADALLGGPQAGLLLGRVDLIERLRRHPLARALRADKVTLAALEATLRGPLTPTRQALTADADELRERVGWLREELTAGGVKADVVPAPAAVGVGAPGVELPSWALALAERYAAPLRLGDPPVVGRVEQGHLLLDLRCINPALDPVVRDAVLAV